jgi:hypothetical protein
VGTVLDGSECAGQAESHHITSHARRCFSVDEVVSIQIDSAYPLEMLMKPSLEISAVAEHVQKRDEHAYRQSM